MFKPDPDHEARAHRVLAALDAIELVSPSLAEALERAIDIDDAAGRISLDEVLLLTEVRKLVPETTLAA